MPKYQTLFPITVSISMLCRADVEAFNEDIARDIALARAKHLSIKSDIFSLQCPRTGLLVKGVIEISRDTDVKIGQAVTL